MSSVERDLGDARLRAERIRAGVSRVRAWVEDVTAAAVNGDWRTLGYESWDGYCDDVIGARIALPREERREFVLTMRESGLSTRAIGSALGVADQTVRADLGRVRDSTQLPDTVRSLDGRERPATQPARAPAAPDPDPGDMAAVIQPVPEPDPAAAAVEEFPELTGLPAPEAVHVRSLLTPAQYEEQTWMGFVGQVRSALRVKGEGGLVRSAEINGEYVQRTLWTAGDYEFVIARLMRTSVRAESLAFQYAEECRARHDVWIDPAAVLDADTA